MEEYGKNTFKHSLFWLTSAFIICLTVIFIDSDEESKATYLREKSRVEQSLEELTQLINAIEYNISSLHPLNGSAYTLPHNQKLEDSTCYIRGESFTGEEYDFLFSGPKDMCQPDSEVYSEAHSRMFIAPTMAYLAKSLDSIASIYFISSHQFIISSPIEFAQSITKNTFRDVITKRPYWVNTIRYGLTQQKDKVIYTGDYEDYLTGKKVVTITRGVYINGDFKGVLALDSFLIDLVVDQTSGYRFTTEQGINGRGLIDFSFSEPIMINGSHSGLYLTVEEPKRIHLFHIIEYKDDQLIMLSVAYLMALAALWYRYSRESQRRLLNLAMLDPMTSLLNRRGFEEQLKRQHEKQYLGIGVFDIDNFKRVNDQFGHDVGDRVIRHVATLVTNSLRREDVVARFGGEEFVVAIYGDSKELIESVFQRVQHDIGLQAFRLKRGEMIPLTISGGAALYCMNHFENSQHLWSSQGIRKADELLYKAKSAGKNQVIVESC